MLHTLFFLLSFVMDYQAVSEAVQKSLLLGSANAGVLCVAGMVVLLRKLLANRG